MEWLLDVEWTKVFGTDVAVLEIVVRGTIMYLGIFVLLRGLLRREAGMVSLPDILMIVLLADAAQNGMADDYHSVTDGLLLVAVIIFWNLALDHLAYWFPAIQRLVHPPPLPLIRHGRVLRRNLRRESISNDELWSHLRSHGVERMSEVKAAFMESNGEITVIKQGKEEEPGRTNRRPV